MSNCWMCEGVFGPKETNGVRELQAFKGYTVDFRLRQFREVLLGMPPVFIDFDSPEGQELNAEMHEEATGTLNEKFSKEAA